VLYLVLIPPVRVEAIIKCRPAFSMLWEHSPDSVHLMPRLQLGVQLHGALPAKYNIVYFICLLKLRFALLFILCHGPILRT